MLDQDSQGRVRILEAAAEIKAKLFDGGVPGNYQQPGGGFFNQHSIVHVAVEQTIYVQNFQTAQILGATRGARLEWRLCVDCQYSSMRL